MQGVFGMARTHGFAAPSADSSWAVVVPAMIEIISVSGLSPVSCSPASSFGAWFGFTHNRIMSDPGMRRL
mgnify:CR=1 FL=1